MRISLKIFPGVRISGSTRRRRPAKSKIWRHPYCDVNHRSEGAALKCAEKMSTGFARPSGTHTAKFVEAAVDLSEAPSEGKTFGNFLAEASERGWTTQNLLVHLPSGEKGAAQGRSFAQMAANAVGKPLRVVDAPSVREGGTVIGLVRAMQHLVPGEVVYLDQIEQFSDSELVTFLTAFCGHLQFEECDEALDELAKSHDLAPTLRSLVASAQEREERVSHILLSGPPGMGKIALARMVADELGSELVATSGPALKHLAHAATVLHSLYSVPRENDVPPPVLFIDEIDQLPASVAELLCDALVHEFPAIRLPALADVPALTLQLVPFVCVGTSTEPGALSQPLRDCFGFHETISLYSTVELAKAVEQIWDRADFKYESGASLLIANWAKGIPQCALHFARLMLQIKDGKVFSVERATQLLADFKDYEDFGDVDWLLLGLQCGSVRAKRFANLSPNESVSMLPHTTVIASTGFRWSRNRDARDAFGSLGSVRDSFRTLVMPEVRSTGETMLRWEMGSVPLI